VSRPEWWDRYDHDAIDPADPFDDSLHDPHTTRIRSGIQADTVGLTEEQARRARCGYYANTGYVDDWLGRLVATLDETGAFGPGTAGDGLPAGPPRHRPGHEVGLPGGAGSSVVGPPAGRRCGQPVRPQPSGCGRCRSSQPARPARITTEEVNAMTTVSNVGTAHDIAVGYRPDPAASLSLHAEAYTAHHWFEVDQRHIIGRTWQWVCHGEKLREPGSYVTGTIAGMPIVIVRDSAGLGDGGTPGALRAFYNVCKHRAHEIARGEGTARALVCPYHAWSYDLGGRLRAARHTGHLVDFDPGSVCLDRIPVTEFAGFVFVNLDPEAAPLESASGELGAEIAHWAPDVEQLTFAQRLSYTIRSNWKNVVDNFLECYHCHVAHKDFVSLVDMDTYTVTTHGVYSSHMAEAGKAVNTAYDVSEATVTDHAVWWLWPNTCLMRYPGRGNFIVLKIIPAGPDLTHETYDFYLETAEPNEAERETMRYLDEVLQVEDINLVESVQRGMSTPAFEQGRIVVQPDGSGLSEHALHHFHGLVLDAYAGAAGGAAPGPGAMTSNGGRS
jgi:choline monooxygenase